MTRDHVTNAKNLWPPTNLQPTTWPLLGHMTSTGPQPTLASHLSIIRPTTGPQVISTNVVMAWVHVTGSRNHWPPTNLQPTTWLLLGHMTNTGPQSTQSSHFIITWRPTGPEVTSTNAKMTRYHVTKPRITGPQQISSHYRGNSFKKSHMILLIPGWLFTSSKWLYCPLGP